MAWISADFRDKVWDSLINGVKWYRRPQLQVYEYFYTIDDFDGIPDGLMEAAEETEWSLYKSNVVRSADAWATWEHASTFWRPELAEEEIAERSVVAVDLVVVDDDGPTQVGDVVIDTPEPSQEVVRATRLQDPRLESVRPVYFAHRGAYTWPVRIIVQPHHDRSWVIQKVHTEDPDGTATFWEAFPVAPNKSEADYQDIYQSGLSAKQSGTRTVAGLMQHFVFADGAEPPGMVIAGSDGADSEGLSSTTAPPFWEDSGTPHNLRMTFSTFLTEITTDPQSGEPVKKSLHEIGAS